MGKTFLHKLFRIKTKAEAKKERITSSTMEELDALEEHLRKKVDFLDEEIQEAYNSAKKYGLADKTSAKRLIRRKKRMEKQVNRLNDFLTCIEAKRETLQAEKLNTESAMASIGANTLEVAANDNLDVNKVDDKLDSIPEQLEVGQEIRDTTANGGKPSDHTINKTKLESELSKLAEERRLDLEKENEKAAEEVVVSNNVVVPADRASASASRAKVDVDNKNDSSEKINVADTSVEPSSSGQKLEPSFSWFRLEQQIEQSQEVKPLEKVKGNGLSSPRKETAEKYDFQQ